MEFIKARIRLDVKFQKARARPGSILKARARLGLGLEKSGLVPPLVRLSAARASNWSWTYFLNFKLVESLCTLIKTCYAD